jgi:hypothetical protein
MKERTKKTRMEKTPDKKTVDGFVNYLIPKMKVDKSFQRKEHWTKKERDSYFEAVSEGYAVSGIIYADIESGMAASEAVGDIAGHSKYKKFWDEGYRYISLEGQNRSAAIRRYLNGEYYFTGILYDLEGQSHHIKNKTFNDMDMSIQLAFRNSTLLTAEVRNAPYKDLPKIFIGLSAGNPLNDTEKRNAMLTPISQWLRETSQSMYSDLWTKYLSKSKIDRMEECKLLTKVFVHLSRVLVPKEKDLGETSLNHFFEKGIGRIDCDDVTAYKKEEQNRVVNILSHVEKATKAAHLKRPIPYKTFWALVFASTHVYDNSLKVADYAKFFESVYNLEQKIERRSKRDQARHIEEYEKNNSSVLSKEKLESDISEKFKDDKYYWRWINRNVSYKFREDRVEMFIENLKSSEEFENCLMDTLSEIIEEAA